MRLGQLGDSHAHPSFSCSSSPPSPFCLWIWFQDLFTWSLYICCFRFPYSLVPQARVTVYMAADYLESKCAERTWQKYVAFLCPSLLSHLASLPPSSLGQDNHRNPLPSRKGRHYWEARRGHTVRRAHVMWDIVAAISGKYNLQCRRTTQVRYTQKWHQYSL